MEQEHTLAIRRRGSSTWSAVDQRSEQGRHLLALFEHPTVEEAMSTATAMPMSPGPDRILHVVPDSKAQFSVVLQAQRLLRDGKDRMYRTSKKAWGWVRGSFLDKAYNMVRTAAAWVLAQAQWVGSYIGRAGVAGLGLMAVTTKSGRWVLSNTIGRVWGWFKKASSMVLNVTLSALDHLGAPGRWIADRVIDVAAFGSKMVIRIQDFSDEHIAGHLALDSKAMAVGQIASVWLVARQALSLLSFTPARYLIMIGTAIFTLFTVPVPEQLSKWYTERFLTQDAKAGPVEQKKSAVRPTLRTSVSEAIKDGVVTTDTKLSTSYKEAVNQAAQDVLDKAAKVIADAPEPAKAMNRNERRAALKEEKREARQTPGRGVQEVADSDISGS